MFQDGKPKIISDFSASAQNAASVVNAFVTGLKRTLATCFPASVYSYDRSTHRAMVVPLVKQACFNGEWVYIRRQVFSVSVRNIQCGGYTVDFPLYVGDTGWVIASDRDTTLIKQDGALTTSVLAANRPMKILEEDYQQIPNQPSLHTLSDGFFIPDNWGTWEAARYKDNPRFAIGNALFLGSSIDTDDDREDEPPRKIYQKGDQYEQKNTASLAINSDGGATLASSTPTAEGSNENTNSGFTTTGGTASVSAYDRNKAIRRTIDVDAADGILIRQDDKKNKKHFVCSLTTDRMLLRILDSDKVFSFLFEDGHMMVNTSGDVDMRVGGDVNFRANGKMNVSTEGDVNLQSSGNVNVNAHGDANVTAKTLHAAVQKSASVVAKEDVFVASGETVNINSGKTLNVGAVETTNINAGANVNFAAGSGINLTAADNINLITAGNTTIMNKAEGATIDVSTLSREANINIRAEGEDSTLSVEMKGNNSSLSVATSGENSPIKVSTEGDGSNVEINSAADVVVTAEQDAVVQAKQNILVTAEQNATIQAETIELNSQELKFLGNQIIIDKEKHVVAQ